MGTFLPWLVPDGADRGGLWRHAAELAKDGGRSQRGATAARSASGRMHRLAAAGLILAIPAKPDLKGLAVPSEPARSDHR